MKEFKAMSEKESRGLRVRKPGVTFGGQRRKKGRKEIEGVRERVRKAGFSRKTRVLYLEGSSNLRSKHSWKAENFRVPEAM